jgi:hydrogenase nickel incorporation protein HypA/HybF
MQSTQRAKSPHDRGNQCEGEAQERADETGAVELEMVRVAVGELSGVDPHLLRSAWKFVTSESADENCRLQIEAIAGRQICPQCGAEARRKASPYPSYCERCKCHMRVESGGGVDLLEIRFQQELVLA